MLLRTADRNPSGPCEFCDEFSGGQQNAFSRLYGPTLTNRLIVESRNFKVIPTLGQIAEGHSLILPKVHYTALADLPSDLAFEFDQIYEQVKQVFKETYGACVFFEHGTRSDCSGGCGIYHAHMHSVPTVMTELSYFSNREKLPVFELDKFREIRDRLEMNSSYLYVEDSNGRRQIASVNSLPSQFMRRAVAEAIGNEDWDWRQCGYQNSFISTLARLRDAFALQLTVTG